MISEIGGRAVVIAPSALGSKDHPGGLSEVPPRRIRQAMYPQRRIHRRNVEKDPWRVSRHDNLPSSPSMASRNEVWKAEGVSTFSLGVLVWGHGIHAYDQSNDEPDFTPCRWCSTETRRPLTQPLHTIELRILWVQVARGSLQATEDFFNPPSSSLGMTLLMKIYRYFVGIRTCINS